MRKQALPIAIDFGAIISVACISYPIGHWLFWRSLTIELSLLLLTGVMIAIACYAYLPCKNRATRILLLIIWLLLTAIWAFFMSLVIPIHDLPYL